MRTMKWNGEYWYCDVRSPFKRARTWLIWIGGWEKTVKTTADDGTVLSDKRWRPRLSWRRGWRRWSPRNIYEGMTPISLCGHRATFFGWGISIKPKRNARALVISRSGARKGQPTKIYLSPDGTTTSATTWFRGWTDDAMKRVAQRAAAQERNESEVYAMATEQAAHFILAELNKTLRATEMHA